mmetsp:Transcript_42663/g.166498  ORF Transcript_42663/g.166498 Transcript_42663/m.166498 type:complete len:458 (-) Transcript_42663:1422-2795(-)
MDTLVQRIHARGGGHFNGLSRRFGGDSIPMNWVLFGLHKQAVPCPGEGSLMLVDARLNVPELTAKFLEASDIEKMFSVITMPCMVMMEVQEDQYMLGSGWAFLGGLPELDGRTNSKYSGLQRIRVMTVIEDNKAFLIVSSEVRPGIVAIMSLAEIDDRHNLQTLSVVDRQNHALLVAETSVCRRMCDMCVLTGDVCDPRECNKEQSFETLRVSRESFLQEMDKPIATMNYIGKLLYGKWTMPVGPLEPVTYDWDCYDSGPSFRYALMSVVQDEMQGVHPPRSSFRLVKQGWEEMEYFLGLEDLDEETFSERGTRREGLAPVVQPSITLDKHVYGWKLHPCATCGTTFRYSSDMKRHLASAHRITSELKCSYCGRRFTQTGHLNEHIRVKHTGLDVHECTFCGKRFGAYSKLQRHVGTVHKKERNFKCNVCGKSYSDKGYLKQHLLKQHDMNTDSRRS